MTSPVVFTEDEINNYGNHISLHLLFTVFTLDCGPVPNVVLRLGTAGESWICHVLAHDKARDCHVGITGPRRDTCHVTDT